MDNEIQDDNLIQELHELIERRGDDLLFGPALTIYAGAFAGTKDENQTLAELERLIMRQ